MKAWQPGTEYRAKLHEDRASLASHAARNGRPGAAVKSGVASGGSQLRWGQYGSLEYKSAGVLSAS